MELAGKAEKLAKRLHPRDKEAAERHAVDAFLWALEKTLAAEVQKLGHRTMEDVVPAARRIEKILEEQPDSKVERLINTMQDQIRILKKHLREANEQIATHKANAPTAAAMVAIAPPTTTTAAAAQAPPAAPVRYIYQDYGEEPYFYRPPRRQMDRRPPRCFLCGEEGHFVSSCPARPILQRLLHQQARVSARAPPRAQILELPTNEDDSNPNSNVHLDC